MSYGRDRQNHSRVIDLASALQGWWSAQRIFLSSTITDIPSVRSPVCNTSSFLCQTDLRRESSGSKNAFHSLDVHYPAPNSPFLGALLGTNTSFHLRQWGANSSIREGRKKALCICACVGVARHPKNGRRKVMENISEEYEGAVRAGASWVAKAKQWARKGTHYAGDNFVFTQAIWHQQAVENFDPAEPEETLPPLLIKLVYSG